MPARQLSRPFLVAVSALALIGVVVATSLATAAPAPQDRPDPAVTQTKLDRVADRAPDTVTGWYVDPDARQLVVETVDVPDAESFVALAGAQDDDVRIVPVDQRPQTFGPPTP